MTTAIADAVGVLDRAEDLPDPAPVAAAEDGVARVTIESHGGRDRLACDGACTTQARVSTSPRPDRPAPLRPRPIAEPTG